MPSYCLHLNDTNIYDNVCQEKNSNRYHIQQVLKRCVVNAASEGHSTSITQKKTGQGEADLTSERKKRTNNEKQEDEN